MVRELGSDALSESELQALGRIVVNFTDLDFAAGHLLQGFISGDVAFPLVAGEDIRWKLEKLSVIANEVISDEEAAKLLRDWARASTHLIDQRNQLMHSFYMSVDGQEALSRVKVSTRGGKWRGGSAPVDLANLSGLADLLAEGWAAAQHVEKKLRACAEWHDHQ